MNSKILMVDDDESILMLYSKTLHHYQYKTTALTSTDDLLRIAIDERPDLIILDIWVPEIGGEAAAELLKNNQFTYNIPILFISANADTDVIAIKVGVEGFLNKPFTQKAFLKKVQEIINAKSLSFK